MMNVYFWNVISGTRQMAQFHIMVTHHQNNGMTNALANADISRTTFFKASW